MEDYAVVRFIERNEYSEIPSNWLVDMDDGQVDKCKWPQPMVKNINYFIKCRYPPQDDWETFDVELIRYSGKYRIIEFNFILGHIYLSSIA